MPEDLFDFVPVALIEHDLTELFRFYDILVSEGVEDIPGYVSGNIEALEHVAAASPVRRMNPAARELLGFGSAGMLDARRPNLSGPSLQRSLLTATVAAYRDERCPPDVGAMERSDGATVRIQLRLSARRDADGQVSAVVSLVEMPDVAALRGGPDPQVRRLRALEALAEAAREADGPEDAPRRMVEAIRVGFQADRAFLVYPCDPFAQEFSIVEASSGPGWAGPPPMTGTYPLDPLTRRGFERALANDRPHTVGPPPPEEYRAYSEAFGVRSQIGLALRPRFGERAWMLGLHQCEYDRVWSDEDHRLLAEIGHKVADALGSAALWRRLREQAATDSLTGLPNRQALEQRLLGLVHTARTAGERHALCYLDLDQFKLVNDTAGHAAGDALLSDLARLLRAKTRAADALARMGGDEFGLLLEHCPLDKAEQIARGLVETVRGFRFEWNGRAFEVGASVGVVEITATTGSVSDVLSRADVACYAAKDAGRNRVHVYRPGEGESSRRHGALHVAASVSEVVQQGRLQLYAQPVVDIQGTGSDPSYEVLLRIREGADGPVGPGAFISAAERFGLMAQVDRWVFDEVLRLYPDHFAAQRARVAINLSGNSLSDAGLLDYIAGRLADPSVPADRFGFEITETAAIKRLDPAREFIDRLRGLGCRFALDDFGAGASSFGYLKDLPVDYLKIDGSFVRDILTERFDRAMVSSVAQLAAELGIQTIAEWVETEEALEMIRGMGIDFAQGWHTGKPAPITREGAP